MSAKQKRFVQFQYSLQTLLNLINIQHTFPGEDVLISHVSEFGRWGGGVCSYSHFSFNHSISFWKSLVYLSNIRIASWKIWKIHLCHTYKILISYNVMWPFQITVTLSICWRFKLGHCNIQHYCTKIKSPVNTWLHFLSLLK